MFDHVAVTKEMLESMLFFVYCSDGYHDDLSRPPTVKIDDIKNMEVGEEEEGGWAGHHEEVDYSKEVVFSDSSDEEGSPKKKRAGKVDSVKSAISQELKGAEAKEIDTKTSEHAQESWKDPSSNLEKPKSPDKSKPFVEDDDGEGLRSKLKGSEMRSEAASSGEMAGKQKVSSHPYSSPQHPGPLPYPVHSQYPPNPNYGHGGGYGVYPLPPQYGPGSSGGPYPMPQMGRGGRYQGGVGGGGHRSNTKKNYGEHDDYREHKDVRTSMRRWEEGKEPARAPVLAKDGEKSPSSPLLGAVPAKSEAGIDAAPGLSGPLPIQQVASQPTDNQEGGPKGHVSFAEGVEKVEGYDRPVAQPARRGNQPKLMLRKLGDKEMETGVDNKHDGKERAGDANGSRPSDLQGLRSDDPSDSDPNKVKTAWNMNERGPISSPKTLYEPEGKKSADKFKKYHAHTQEPIKMGMSESQKSHGNDQELVGTDSQNAPDQGIEKIKSPTEKENKDMVKHVDMKKQQVQGHELADSEKKLGQGRRGSKDEKHPSGEGKKPMERKRKKSEELEKGSLLSLLGPANQEKSVVGVDNNQYNSSSDKPHHRKEDSRRPRGGSGEKRADFPSRTDNSRYPTSGPRRGKDKWKRESFEVGNKAGARQENQQERRYPDLKRRDPPRSREGERTGQADRKQTRRDDGRNSTEHPNRGGNRMAKDVVHHSESRPDNRRYENERGRTGSGGSLKRGGNRQDESRRNEHPVRGKHPEKDVFPKASSQKKLEVQDFRGKELMGEKDRPHLALGCSGLDDIFSSSDYEDIGMGKQSDVGVVRDRIGGATSGKGGPPAQKGQRKIENKNKQRGDGRKGKIMSERGPRAEMIREQPLQSGGANKKSGRQKEERKRGAEQKMDSSREFARGSQGDRKELERSALPNSAKTHAVPSVINSTIDKEMESQVESGQNFSSRFDLKSPMVVIADEIGSHGTAGDWPSPTEAVGGFVQVTSKKNKGKIRKEKEELRKEEEKRFEQQKGRKKKPAVTSGQAGVDRLTSSSIGPSNAWCSLDNESWNAAPGSQLKSTPQQWPMMSGTLVPRDDMSGRDTGLEGRGGVSKVAVPLNAGLVSGTSAGTEMYDLFNGMNLYSHFSPATTSTTSSMLDAAVESTIGTVTSPLAVASHTPLLMNNALTIPRKQMLPEVGAPLASELQVASVGHRARDGLLITPDLLVSKNLPPYQKSVGRDRGARVGAGDKRGRVKGKYDKDHGIRQERTASNPEVRSYSVRMCLCLGSFLYIISCCHCFDQVLCGWVGACVCACFRVAE